MPTNQRLIKATNGQFKTQQAFTQATNIPVKQFFKFLDDPKQVSAGKRIILSELTRLNFQKPIIPNGYNQPTIQKMIDQNRDLLIKKFNVTRNTTHHWTEIAHAPKLVSNHYFWSAIIHTINEKDHVKESNPTQSIDRQSLENFNRKHDLETMIIAREFIIRTTSYETISELEDQELYDKLVEFKKEFLPFLQKQGILLRMLTPAKLNSLIQQFENSRNNDLITEISTDPWVQQWT